MSALWNRLDRVFTAVLPSRVYQSVRRARRYVVSLKYWGRKYECPFCSGHFSGFLPAGFDLPVLKEKQVVGGGYRLNAICPRCRSRDRERLIYFFLKKEKPEVFSGKLKLLHVAPEENLAQKLKSNLRMDYTSADLCDSRVDVQMDITDIKQPAETYDVIICNHVLEHIPDDRKAMSELFRVLKKGGFAILQVPISFSSEHTLEDFSVTSQADRERVFGQRDHVRIYGRDYSARLKEAGFAVSERQIAENLAPEDVDRFRLLKQERLFVCSKA